MPFQRAFAEREMVEPPEQRGKGEAALQAGEGRARAIVDAIAEREVGVALPPEIEAIGIGESTAVAVGRVQERKHPIAGLKLGAAELERLAHDAGHGGERAVVTE